MARKLVKVTISTDDNEIFCILKYLKKQLLPGLCVYSRIIINIKFNFHEYL